MAASRVLSDTVSPYCQPARFVGTGTEGLSQGDSMSSAEVPSSSNRSLIVQLAILAVVELIILAVAIALTTWLLPGIHVSGGVLTYLWIALIFGLVNGILGPVLHFLALPLTALTWGLFAFVVNAALLGITAWLSGDLSIDGFFPALFASILISVFATVLGLLLRPRV
jgi:putative membrane protein